MTPKEGRWACDISVAIPALDPNHEAHAPCRRALVEYRPALSGHAAYEAHSVLTRLPVPLRLAPAQAARVLAAAFPDTCWLGPQESGRLRGELGERGIVGGAVFDALVGRAAAADQRVLLTRDRRAERTYRALDIDHYVVVD